MLIVSKFRDYYDSIAKTTGIDREFVFSRKTTPIPAGRDLVLSFPRRSRTVDGIEQGESIGAVIFCGRLHPYLYSYEGPKESFCYDLEQIKEFIGKGHWFEVSNLDSLAAAMARDYTPLCIEYGTPIILIHHKYTEKTQANPRLADVCFFRVKPAVPAFQEIFQFVSGVLAQPHKVPRPVSDVLKVRAAGFDSKVSFRKEGPPARKQRRKEKGLSK